MTDPFLLPDEPMDELYDEAAEPEITWTRGRVLALLIAVLVILALVLMLAWPLILVVTTPTPQPIEPRPGYVFLTILAGELC